MAHYVNTDHLVKALRYCSAVGMCDDCRLKTIQKEFGAPFCDDKLKQEAADAIEQQAEKIEELEAKIPRWIPCSERLPEVEGKYIVCTAHDSVTTVRFDPVCGRFQRIFTHWMPLPSTEGLEHDT